MRRKRQRSDGSDAQGKRPFLRSAPNLGLPASDSLELRSVWIIAQYKATGDISKPTLSPCVGWEWKPQRGGTLAVVLQVLARFALIVEMAQNNGGRKQRRGYPDAKLKEH